MYPASRPFGRALPRAAGSRTTVALAALTILAATLVPSTRALGQSTNGSGERARVAILNCAGVACPAPVAAPVDSGRNGAAHDSVARTPAVPRTARPSRRGPAIFVGVVGAALVANSFVHLDNDPGGYQDSWNSEASFPDKAVHGLAAFAITSIGVDLHLRPVYAALTTCAAGAIFETTQGYVSKYDIAADCIGAGLAGAWRHWRASR